MEVTRFAAATRVCNAPLPCLMFVLLPALALCEGAADIEAPERHGAVYVIGMLILKFIIVTPIVAAILQLLVRHLFGLVIGYVAALRVAAVVAVMVLVWRIMINSIAMAGLANSVMRIIDEGGAFVIGCWGLALGVAGLRGHTFRGGLPAGALAAVAQFVLLLLLTAVLAGIGVNQDWAGGAGERAKASRQEVVKASAPASEQPLSATVQTTETVDVRTAVVPAGDAGTAVQATWSSSITDAEREQAKKDALAVPKY